MLDYVRRVPWMELLGRSRRWLLTFLLIFVAYLCYSLIYLPAWHRNQEAWADLEKHRADQSAAEGVFAVMRATKHAWEQQQQQIGQEFFSARAPEDQDVVVLSYFYRIRQIARDSGVTLVDLSQGAEVKNTPSDDKTMNIIEHALTLRLAGTYDQVTDFLARLAASPRLARVDTAVVTANAAQAGRLEVVVKGALLFFLPEAGGA